MNIFQDVYGNWSSPDGVRFVTIESHEKQLSQLKQEIEVLEESNKKMKDDATGSLGMAIKGYTIDVNFFCERLMSIHAVAQKKLQEIRGNK